MCYRKIILLHWLCVYKDNDYNNSNDNNDNVNTNNNDKKSNYEQGGKKSKDIDWNSAGKNLENVGNITSIVVSIPGRDR